MENKVGDVVPTEKEVEATVKEINAVEKRIIRYTITLTKEQKKRALRWRTGGERVVALVAELAEKHDVTVPNVPIEGMKADLTLTQRVVPIEVAANAIVQRVVDTRLQAEAECWLAATTYYSVLARIAMNNPELAAALKPAKEFFAIGSRKKAATNGKKVTPSGP